MSVKYLATFHTFLFLSFVLLPVCHLTFCQMITNTGLLCVFRHLSTITMTAMTETNVHFRLNKETWGTSFQKWNYSSAVSFRSLDMSSSLSILLCLYPNIISILSVLNHVHLPYRLCLQQGSAQAWLRLLLSIHSKWWKSVSRPTEIPSKRLIEIKFCLNL